MSDNLRDRVAEVLVNHAAAEYSWGVDGCECGFEASDLMKQAAHQADKVTDLLIDMAGQGKLLKAIDRMYRDE